MKAAVINKFGDTGVFEFSDIPVPILKSDEILIEVISGSVNPVDCKQRKGNHRFIFGSPFPIVLGYDVAGIVVKTGSDVGEFKIGDKVCGVLSNKYGGGLSQFAKGKKKCFTIVPDTINHSHSATLPLVGLTALQALRDKGKIKPHDKVLIIGAAGGVGHYALQIANLFVAQITVVSSQRHKQFLDNFGFSTFVDYNKTNILLSTDKYDIILDTIGKYSFRQCKHLLNGNGIYINTLPRPKILVHKFLSIFSKGKMVKTLLMKHAPDDLAQLIKWVEEGKLKIMIDREFTVNEIGLAHRYSEDGHTEGKILIKHSW